MSEKNLRTLIPMLGLGAYALVMFVASGFFLSNYQELMLACGRYSASDCSANDAIVVSSISLKIGTVVFFLMGSFAWAIASYLAVRFVKLRAFLPLP